MDLNLKDPSQRLIEWIHRGEAGTRGRTSSYPLDEKQNADSRGVNQGGNSSFQGEMTERRKMEEAERNGEKVSAKTSRGRNRGLGGL